MSHFVSESRCESRSTAGTAARLASGRLTSPRTRRSRDGLAVLLPRRIARRAVAAQSGSAARQARCTGSTPAGHRRARRITSGARTASRCSRSRTSFERASQSGYDAYCKPCHNARGKRRTRRSAGQRTYHLTRRYGITAEEADAMLERAGRTVRDLQGGAGRRTSTTTTRPVRSGRCSASTATAGWASSGTTRTLLHAAAYYVEFHTPAAGVVARGGRSRAASDRSEPAGRGARR